MYAIDCGNNTDKFETHFIRMNVSDLPTLQNAENKMLLNNNLSSILLMNELSRVICLAKSIRAQGFVK